ncbi:MAG: SAM-dependent chlorinase/fluorinase [candidate division WOR-3 bacterium]|jgi:S-adenosylmethionine hydrolase
MPVVTLTTDFGIKDPYVAMVKGAILKINPDITCIDITNQIDAGDISTASFIIENSYGYFPSGSAHLVVVDPTVGSKRRAIFSFKNKHFFIGPDNGVLTPFLSKTFEIKKGIGKKSGTFDGRDLFAEAAARLASGERPEKLGKKINNPVKIKNPSVLVQNNHTTGEIIYIDKFGNLISNIKEEHIPRDIDEILIKGTKIQKLSKKYSEGKKNKPIALINSGFKTLEICLNRGNASSFLNSKVGEKITVRGKNG